MAKKPVKKTTTRRPSIMLVDFIEQEEKKNIKSSDLVIENKIVKDDFTSDILFPDYEEVKFTKVNFTGAVNLYFRPETQVLFEDCTFDKKPTITGSDKIKFNHCKFKLCVDVRDVDYEVSFNNCEVKNSLDIEKCSNVYISNSTIYKVLISKCLHGELYFGHSNFNQINVVDSHCSDFSASNIKCERIELNRCYIDDVFIFNAFKDKIDTLALWYVYISDTLDICGQRINRFDATRTTVVEECEFRSDYIKEWNLQFTNGIVPPSNEIILYKKVAIWHGSKCCKNRIIAKLVVPAEAKRVYCGLHKIRVSEAKCVGFYNCDGTEYKPRKGYVITSLYTQSYYYQLNKICKPTVNFDETTGTCGAGIHGFIEFDEAVKY